MGTSVRSTKASSKASTSTVEVDDDQADHKIAGEIRALLLADTRTLADTARELTAEHLRHLASIEETGTAQNTRRSYATAERYWRAWHLLRFKGEMVVPVAPAVVLYFILDHFETRPDPDKPEKKHLLPEPIEKQLLESGMKKTAGPLKPGTVEQRVSVLSQMHDKMRDAMGNPIVNPCRDPYVKKLLKLVRKTYNRRPGAKAYEGQRDAATLGVLDQMLAHCNTDSLRDVRDRAVLLVGFSSGGRRRSEIAGMQVEDLIPDGTNYTWKLGHTKTKLDDTPKPIHGRAAEALREWLGRSGVRYGPVFLEINVHDRPTTRPMSDQAIYRLVKRLAVLAGVPGAWGAHSLRVGFLTQSGRDGDSIAEAMALSGHESIQTALRYYRAGEVATSALADKASRLTKREATAAPAKKSRKRRTPKQP